MFGEVAGTYDRVRPTYPESLVGDVILHAGVTRGDPALEVGAGTGRATALFAVRGLAVTAIEPSHEMAAVARQNLRPYPGVVVVEELFEHWDGPALFPLVYAAQAWHWVPLEHRYATAHRVLRPQGSLAVFWNRPDWSNEPELRARLDEVYDRIAPDLPTRGPGSTWTMSATDHAGETVAEIEASGLFGDVEVHDYTHHRRYSTDDYLALLSTQSDHRLLDDDHRRRLLDAVGAEIDQVGGSVRLGYVTRLYLARSS